MIRTAFLRDLTPSLCEAITGVPDCAKFLKKLVRKGAFITQTQKGIYRYHHLFRQFLKNIAGEYGADFEMGLLEKEGHWHLSQEDFYSAIECFIQNKNHDGIEQCFALLNASPRIAAKRVLPILKHREFTRAAKKHPHLLYFVAYAALIEGRASDAAAFMDEYYVRFPEIVSRYPGLVHGIHFMRIVDFRFTIYQMTDRITTPEDLAKVPIHIWRLSMHISMMHRGINDLSELALGDVLDNIKCRLLPKLSWLYAGGFGADIKIIAAGLLYEQGKLFEAYEHAFDAYAILEQHPFSDTKQCTLLLLTDILDALGDKEGADTFLQSVPKMIEKERAYHLYDNFNAFIIRRKIVADKVEDVEDWLNAKTTDSLFLWEIYVAVTTCRAFIFIKKYDSAILLLKRVLEMATQFIRPSDIIEARILLSIAYWKKKRGLQKKALEQLDAAVSLAYKYDFVQMFIYNGAELADMLYKLLKQIEQRKDKHYISFVKILHMKTRSYLMRETTDEDFCNINPIDFTDRQSSITNLLCQGKTYKEIAEFLGIKQSSVASHIKLIYKKLDVKTAADAVAKVNAMNLGIAHQ
ncbi:MAG: LuxR C-terminal-related transcriptional regulator [Defluviitaleaceae bacterium]|nr:LuxR C-terminal-related transcriptional regulator [Defluviitaleaceae bacterium]